jgi:hypothetical protein
VCLRKIVDSLNSYRRIQHSGKLAHQAQIADDKRFTAVVNSRIGKHLDGQSRRHPQS